MGVLKYIAFVLILFFQTTLFAYQVYFSPQDDLDKVIVGEVLKAKKSIDISIYTFRSEPVVEALVQKLKENPKFKLRLLVRRVGMDSLSPYISPLEVELQRQGLDASNIRFVNVTNHHKFMIVDGKTLLNTSGNFNTTKLAAGYDENLFVCSRTCPKLVNAFQEEFEYLYAHSNYLLLEDEMPFDSRLKTPNPKDWSDVAFFTSENFEATERGSSLVFRVKKDLEQGWVEKNLIHKIESAKKSIQVATGHLRSYTLANALAEASKRGIKVELILDSQEYISEAYQTIEDQEKEECLLEGKDLEDCVEVGFHFGRWLHEQGVDVYFKYYMIFWDFIHAPQMHHKYMIIDNKVLYTGSYNWSKNAEFKTFENKAIITHPKTVEAYIQNFKEMKNYGQGKYSDLIQKWAQEKKEIRLVFEPMALSVDEIDGLREFLKTRCTQLFKAPSDQDIADEDMDDIKAESKTDEKPKKKDKHRCEVDADLN